MTHGTLAVRSLGSGTPAFVLLHGLAGSGRYWGEAFDRLADRGRLVVPDLLGFGASPHPDSDYGPDDHADAVARSLVELGVEGPVVVAGHSLGALVALRLAVRRPELVAAVVVFGPAVFASPEQARQRIRHSGLFNRLFALDTRWASHACRWMCRHRAAAARLAHLLRPDLPPSIASDSVQHTWASYSQTLENVMLSAHGIEWLGQIAAPINIVVGEHDRIGDRALLEQLARRHAHVTVETWPGGHDLPLTHPDECVAAILDAARRHPQLR